MTLSKLWRLWCLSLGDKASDNTKDADMVAIMRSIVVLVNFVTKIVSSVETFLSQVSL